MKKGTNMVMKTVVYDQPASGWPAGFEELSTSELTKVAGGWLFIAVVLFDLFEAGFLGGMILHDCTR